MFKRIGLSMALLAGMLAFAAPRKANAEVHFGVYVGAPAPVYSYPAYPAYGYDPYYAAPVYSYPAPAYVAPYSYGYSSRYRDHDRHEWRERDRRDSRDRRDFRGRR